MSHDCVFAHFLPLNSACFVVFEFATLATSKAECRYTVTSANEWKLVLLARNPCGILARPERELARGQFFKMSLRGRELAWFGLGSQTVQTCPN